MKLQGSCPGNPSPNSSRGRRHPNDLISPPMHVQELSRHNPLLSGPNPVPVSNVRFPHFTHAPVLNYLIERRSQVYVPAHPIANIYTGLGEHDKALQWFEMADEERHVESVWLKEHWRYDALRSDPRFQSILTRMGFPE